ncbi:hypothetical protein GGTG_05457 [Gaeumannomyces tritici R3-111a-1]|uniref:Uncharacterized protein n=1 Tax=Gaeumannomyces tritici (strain R3-111a-1) TaxID=644352 RepID=J3NVZ4_GAET3|nr:hypothetical protein GGTG_05457 [Gaeumannomyces tritici R3-111a-1]EJT75524.1 hypothetical protein GGTG_05457 [Gaeumannomyces tritici R3-111a-1]
MVGMVDIFDTFDTKYAGRHGVRTLYVGGAPSTEGSHISLHRGPSGVLPIEFAHSEGHSRRDALGLGRQMGFGGHPSGFERYIRCLRVTQLSCGCDAGRLLLSRAGWWAVDLKMEAGKLVDGGRQHHASEALMAGCVVADAGGRLAGSWARDPPQVWEGSRQKIRGGGDPQEPTVYR